MAASQPPMPGAGLRPNPAPGQPMVLQHHPQAHLASMMQNPATAAPFAPGGNYTIPLQHAPQRPIINGLQPGVGVHGFAAMHNNPNALRQAHMRLQPQGLPVGQLAQYQPQLPHGMHPHTMQQLHFQQHQQQLQQPQQQQQQQQQQQPQQQQQQQQAQQHPPQQQQPQQPQPQQPPNHVMRINHDQPPILQGQGMLQRPPIPGPSLLPPSQVTQLLTHRPSPLPFHRFSQFAAQLSAANASKTKASFWKRFVQEWFTPNASMKLVMGEGPQQGGKEYDLPIVLIHRFFHIIHTSGVRQMHIILGVSQPETPQHIIDCQTASILYRFENGCQLVWDGPLRVQFKALNGDLKIERLEIVKDEFSELVPRNSAKVPLTTPPLSNRSISPEARKSPAERSVIGQVTHGAMGASDRGEETSISSPRSDINDIGIPKEVMVFLEVAEVCVYIQPLIDFAIAKDISPQHALKMYPSHHGKVFQQQPNAFPYPPQPPQLTSPMNEMSPMVTHATMPGLTNSPQPHYPSPMSSQTSQTGQTGPNTTPLLANRQPPSSAPAKTNQNKRRRGSNVANMAMKEEDEDGVPSQAARPPKQSPRIGVGGRGGAPGGPPGKRLRGES